MICQIRNLNDFRKTDIQMICQIRNPNVFRKTEIHMICQIRNLNDFRKTEVQIICQIRSPNDIECQVSPESLLREAENLTAPGKGPVPDPYFINIFARSLKKIKTINTIKNINPIK